MEKNLDDMSLEELEAELAKLDSTTKDYGSPEPEKKESWFKFLREIINRTDSKKLGNVEKPELGLPDVPIRGAFDIAHFARTQGLEAVANYLDTKAYTTLETSLAKKGFLIQMAVTQIKKEQKGGGHQFIEKKGLFGTKQVPVKTVEEE